MLAPGSQQWLSSKPVVDKTRLSGCRSLVVIQKERPASCTIGSISKASEDSTYYPTKHTNSYPVTAMLEAKAGSYPATYQPAEWPNTSQGLSKGTCLPHGEHGVEGSCPASFSMYEMTSQGWRDNGCLSRN